MRYVVKPKLKRTGTPTQAFRSFEMCAPFLFSKPRGTQIYDGPLMRRISVGTPEAGRAILYLHGGAFVAGSRKSYCAFAARLAKRTSSVVFLPDYPLLQKQPFPAAPDAIISAWDDLIESGFAPHQIVLAGDSAGGNLAFGLLATLLARGQRPAGAVGFSPWADLTLSGATIDANSQADPLIPVSRMREVVELYMNGADPADPRASPKFAQFPDPPPVLIQVGETEVLRSDSEVLAQKTKGTIEVWPHVPHVWQIFDGRLPEANAAMRKVAAFVQTSFESAKR